MTDETTPHFEIQRIYAKDISFEAPKSPEVFLGDFQPEVKFEINTGQRDLKEDRYEVTVSVTVSAELEDKQVIFLLEATQAGLFLIKDMSQEQMGHALGSYAPSILFPYLRELVSEMVSRGSFPQLFLAPINFDALFAEQMSKQAE